MLSTLLLAIFLYFLWLQSHQRFTDLVACVASVSARVNALKLEREQKNKTQERAYSGIPSRCAWRLDREMWRRIILRKTGFTR